jgi:hypothetical protein
MRELKRVVLGLVCASMLLAVPVLAQESSGTQSSSQDYNSSTNDPWKEAGPGVKYVYIPAPKTPPSQPEFLLLQLSAEKYTQFTNNPKGFVNDLQGKFKVLSEPIRSATACPSCESKSDPSADETYYYVFLRHWPTSDAAYQVSESWQAPAKK